MSIPVCHIIVCSSYLFSINKGIQIEKFFEIIFWSGENTGCCIWKEVSLLVWLVAIGDVGMSGWRQMTKAQLIPVSLPLPHAESRPTAIPCHLSHPGWREHPRAENKRSPRHPRQLNFLFSSLCASRILNAASAAPGVTNQRPKTFHCPFAMPCYTWSERGRVATPWNYRPRGP